MYIIRCTHIIYYLYNITDQQIPFYHKLVSTTCIPERQAVTPPAPMDDIERILLEESLGFSSLVALGGPG